VIKIVSRAAFPKCLQDIKEVKGICAGGCIEGREWDGMAAHAHAEYPCDEFQGWMCLRHKGILHERLTLLHEAAHLIANKDPRTPGHGKKWKRAVMSIGGTFKGYSYKHSGLTWEYPDFTYRNN